MSLVHINYKRIKLEGLNASYNVISPDLNDSGADEIIGVMSVDGENKCFTYTPNEKLRGGGFVLLNIFNCMMVTQERLRINAKKKNLCAWHGLILFTKKLVNI